MNIVRPIKRITRSRLHGAYERTFNTPDGRIVLNHLMKTGHVTTPVAHGNREQSLRNEGAQHLVLSIMRFLRKTPEQVSNQITEAIDEDLANYQ